MGYRWTEGSPGGSGGKESACNTDDPSMISGSGRSPGEGWGSLVGCHLWGRTESDTTKAMQQQQQCVYENECVKFHKPEVKKMCLLNS